MAQERLSALLPRTAGSWYKQEKLKRGPQERLSALLPRER